MIRRRAAVLLVLACGGLIGAAGLRVSAEGRRGPTAREERALRGGDIAFYAMRARRDPRGAADLAQLAGLFLQRGRETGDVHDFRRAEQVARRSIANRADHNAKAYLVLASSLLAQHRFTEARAAAETLCTRAPEMDGHRALLGEIELELGDYAAAARTFATLAGAWRNLAVAPRLARWAEVRGRTEEARYILAAAQAEAMRRPDLPREQRVWFHLRVADLELRNGRLDEAERALALGQAVDPDDARLLGAQARLEALRGRWTRAIDYGGRVGAGADIATLALVGDAYAALGDTAQAETYYAAVERAAAERPEPFNRQWTQFRLEHRRALAETRAILEREILERPDVYGYDQLARARYLTGDYPGAQAAMREAVRLRAALKSPRP